MDAWEDWRVVCLSPLSAEDVEDVYIFGFMITGLLLIGAGIALVRWEIKDRLAIKSPAGLPVMIEGVLARIDAVGRAVSTQTLAAQGNMDKIMEQLMAMQRMMNRSGDRNEHLD